jgi:transcriptional regulator with XRE-family HTH domain
MPRPRSETIGQRIRRYRQDRGMSLSQLAVASGVSKSYLSELESMNGNDTAHGPSADVLYRIGNALGIAMSDLLGRPIITRPTKKRPPSLMKFAEEANLPESDIEMLASIKFRGQQPKTADRWAFIYQAIKNSAGMDP